MLCPENIVKHLNSLGVDYFAGVPDSLLKDFCALLQDTMPTDRHVIAANEGGAIALASGYYLSSQKLALVYLQNSGFGNCVNPLMSLAAPEVYSIPMLLLIGWRGEPHLKDEPQHMKQGQAMEDLLKSMDIPYDILQTDEAKACDQFGKMAELATEQRRPVAFLVKKNTFSPYQLKSDIRPLSFLKREKALQLVIDALPTGAVVLSTTGKTSRELYEYRTARQSERGDFYNVGAMGHVSQIALGVAHGSPDKLVVCLDGDGSLIMHMGSMGVIGQKAPNKFCHIVFNNSCHESVGGQPTYGGRISFSSLAREFGYRQCKTVKDEDSLVQALKEFDYDVGPSLLEILICPGSRSNLGRPKTSPIENKEKFMQLFSGKNSD